MSQSYNDRRRFELFVSVTVIAIIASVGLGRYNAMAKEAQIKRFELLSHNFLTGAANIRVKYLVEHAVKQDKSPTQALTIIDEKPVYFSPQGWPASLQAINRDGFQPKEEDCYQLWRLFLQNPPAITQGMTEQIETEFSVQAERDFCRYELLESGAFFDYFPLTGQLMFQTDGL